MLSSGTLWAKGWTEIGFPTGTRIVDHVAVDLNGDKRDDLLLVRGRRVELYMHGDSGFDAKRPVQRFNFVDNAILWTHADLDGDKRAEILYLASDGVYAYKWQRDRLSFAPTLLFKTEAILQTASPDEVRWKPFFDDRDGDGVRDLLLPGADGLLLYQGLAAGGFRAAQKLSLRAEVSVTMGLVGVTDVMRSRYFYPQPHSGDANGDGLADLFFHQRQQVVVFLQRPGGRFGPNPERVLPLLFSGALPEGRLKLDLQLPTRFADLDGDGLIDIVATHVGRAVTQVFRGGRDVTKLEQPEVLLRLSGLTFFDHLADLDGDGRQDLVLVRTDRPGLWDLIKVLVTKEVHVEAFVYFGREKELLPRMPDTRRMIDIPILFASGKRGFTVGTSAVISLAGDFDGDKRNDLLLRKDDRRIAVYRNLGRKGFSADPVYVIEVHSMDGYRFILPTLRDLNNDGVADVILAYHSWDGDEDRLSVLLSTPGGR